MIYVMPDSGNAPYLDFINNAKGYIDVNMYFIDYKPVIDALSDAETRHNLKVFVIIDGKPFRLSSYLINKEKSMLEDVNIVPKESPSWFRYDHAKYMVSSNEVLISTANTDTSAFHRNREYVYISDDKTLVKSLTNIFNTDYSYSQQNVSVSSNIVLSPQNSSGDILVTLSQSGPVYIETEELGNDDDIMAALEAKGSQAYLILPSSISDSNKENVDTLIKSGVHVALMDKSRLYMHAKIIVGLNYWFMGSENFSQTSLRENREVGIIMKSNDNAGDSTDANLLYHTFRADWDHSQKLD